VLASAESDLPAAGAALEDAAVTASRGTAVGEAPATRSGPPALTLAGELTGIAADLSQEVSQHPETWQLGSLRRRTQAVIDASESLETRDQGLRLLARIAQFEDLQRRHKQLTRSAAPMVGLNDNTSRPGRSRNGAPREGLPRVNVHGYDGLGWLMPVASQHRRSPRYVLTDDKGNILQFVTPSPGMNLRRYERKQVGVYGQRGFLPSLKQPHLVAERIVSLETLRR
jgi:hypothetical protein